MHALSSLELIYTSFRFGLLQFHTNLSLVLHSKTKYASMVFSVMTLEAVRAATKQLELTVCI